MIENNLITINYFQAKIDIPETSFSLQSCTPINVTVSIK